MSAKLSMIDLFAGIGGFRLGFERAGFDCVFSSEIDKFARQSYNANFGVEPHGDITLINENEIPDYDVLTAGFSCQPFSSSGVIIRNAMGLGHGLDDLDKQPLSSPLIVNGYGAYMRRIGTWG